MFLVAVVLAPVVVRQNGSGRVARLVGTVRGALVRVRTGLRVFRDPRRGSLAAGAQLGAWGIQLLACAALFQALGLEGGIGAAAGIGAFAIVLAGTTGMRRRRPARPQTIATH